MDRMIVNKKFRVKLHVGFILLFVVVHVILGCNAEQKDEKKIEDKIESKINLRINDWGPQKTSAGQGFNVQPTGISALWFNTEDATETTVVMWDANELKTQFEKSTLVTAGVADNLYATPGKYEIYLLDKKNNNKSNKVVFTIE